MSRTEARTEVVEIAMPDGTLVNAEVLISDSMADVGVQSRLRLGEARESIASFVRWAVSGVTLQEADGAGQVGELESSLPGMTLGKVELEFGLKLAVKAGALTSVIAAVGGEATAVVRLEWERIPVSGGHR